jgi:AcrR family transcriptional regulator
MIEKTSSVEEKIIFATIECIEKYGISGATNRRISEIARVNLASINYYFRSKEALIQRVFEITLKNAFDFGNITAMPGATATERCIAIFVEIIEGSFNYPGITRAHFFNLLAEGQYDALLVEHANRFIDELAEDMIKRESTLEIEELKLALTQIFLSVMMSALTPGLFGQQPGMNLRDPDVRLAFVTRLVTRLLEEDHPAGSGM